MKYLGVYLSKHIQDSYAENYTMLLKETKEYLNKQATHYVHELEDSIAKRSILLKFIYMFNVILIKVSIELDIENIIVKYTLKGT